MKKNVIVVLIDALNVDNIYEKSYKPSPAPYLNELKKDSIFFEEVYSSAPYTEGAMIELMCGYDTLDRNSFMENLKNAPKTLFEVISDHGYEVYSSIYNYPNNEGFLRGVKYPRIMGLVTPKTLWNYRYKYYATLYEKKQLTEYDYEVLNTLLEECLKGLIENISLIEKDDYKVSLINRVDSDYNKIQKQKDYLSIFNEDYNSDKINMVNSLLEQGESHDFFSMPIIANWPQTKEMKNIHSSIIVKYKETIDKMSKIQRKGNEKHSGKIIRNFLKTIVAGLMKLSNKEIQNNKKIETIWLQLLELSIYTDYNIKSVFSKKSNVSALKDTPCALTQMEDFLSWFDQKRQKNQPFLSFLHLDDLHVSPIPYSYSSNDAELIDLEMIEMNRYVNELDSTYHGNIMYDVAIKNLDNKIKWFMNELNKRGALKDTKVVFTSDHGFYYSYNAFRVESIENIYKENYHILFMIYEKDSGINSINSNLHKQKDIPMTLLRCLDLPAPKSFSGLDMINGGGRKFATIEFPGRGCPDLMRKTLFLAAFNTNYKVLVKVKLKEQLTMKNIVEIYDLQNDEFEINNLCKKRYDKLEVDYLYSKIVERFDELNLMYS